MPPLILFGLVGAAAYYGYQRLQREATRVVERNRRSEAELRTGAQGTLKRGEDGVYRLHKD
ncbi:hypothetical protein [Aureimonas jatrophae]|uniref:Uncharacterized protein n=1 Tax=Aureimonas jatrophae TaxID=1166073 RepID=A0A1H0GLT1_9HYPH|nr:hypothetical protein [Aureimonas jatrophae]SDO07844.1 hypothetical protein SAMN05192530_103191 [Aureimonas jatrophae]